VSVISYSFLIMLEFYSILKMSKVGDEKIDPLVRFFGDERRAVALRWAVAVDIPHQESSEGVAKNIIPSVLASDPVREAIDRAVSENEAQSDSGASVVPTVAEAEASAERMLRRIASRGVVRYVERIMAFLVGLVVRRLFTFLHVNPEGVKTLRNLLKERKEGGRDKSGKKSVVVFLPTHRSYMDFLIIPFVCFVNSLPLPHIAAGEDFLNIAGVNWLFRRSGAFFLRRTFGGDYLYASLFKEYTRQLALSGESVMFFVEGTRSRSGRQLHPKMGMVSIVYDLYAQGLVDDIYFIPMSICYERVMEDALYVREMVGKSKIRESLSALVRGALSIFNRKLGRVHVHISKPVSANEVAAKLSGGEMPTQSMKKELVGTSSYHVGRVLENTCACTSTCLVSLSVLALNLRESLKKGDQREGLGLAEAMQSLNLSAYRTMRKSEVDDFINWLRGIAIERGCLVQTAGKQTLEEVMEIFDGSVLKYSSSEEVQIDGGEGDTWKKSLLLLGLYGGQLLNWLGSEAIVMCALTKDVEDGKVMTMEKLLSRSVWYRKLMRREFAAVKAFDDIPVNDDEINKSWGRSSANDDDDLDDDHLATLLRAVRNLRQGGLITFDGSDTVAPTTRTKIGLVETSKWSRYAWTLRAILNPFALGYGIAIQTVINDCSNDTGVTSSELFGKIKAITIDEGGLNCRTSAESLRNAVGGLQDIGLLVKVEPENRSSKLKLNRESECVQDGSITMRIRELISFATTS